MVRKHNSNRLLARLRHHQALESNKGDELYPTPLITRSDSYDSTSSGESQIPEYSLSVDDDKLYSGYEHLELSDSMESMHIGDVEEDGSADWETVHSGDDEEMGDEDFDSSFKPPFDHYNSDAYYANQGYPLHAQYMHEPYNWQEDQIAYTGFIPHHLVEQAAIFFGQHEDFQQDSDSYEAFLQDVTGTPPEPTVDSCNPETLVFSTSPSRRGAGEEEAPLVIETWQVKDVDVEGYTQSGSSLPIGLINEILEYHPGVAYPFDQSHPQSRAEMVHDDGGLCMYNGRVFKAEKPLRENETALWDVRPRSALDRRKGCWRRLRERGGDGGSAEQW